MRRVNISSRIWCSFSASRVVVRLFSCSVVCPVVFCAVDNLDGSTAIESPIVARTEPAVNRPPPAPSGDHQLHFSATISSQPSNTIEKWNTELVSKWLEENGLQHQQNRLIFVKFYLLLNEILWYVADSNRTMLSFYFMTFVHGLLELF